MICTITSLTLDKPWGFFRFSWDALQITKQLRGSGQLSFQKGGIGMTHYTMTTWPDRETMQAFARSGAHLEAMKKSARYAREIRTYTFEADAAPAWEDAKSILLEKGKVLRFGNRQGQGKT